MRLNEQTRETPSPFKEALLSQISELGGSTTLARRLWNALTPRGQTEVEKRNKVMRDFIVPGIEDKISSDKRAAAKKTVVDLAIKHLDEEGTISDGGTGKPKADSEFIERLLAHIKIFLFAGHDTTATTICWMFKLLQDNPETLEKLRAEHDAVLGADINKAPEIILASPHLLFSLPYTLGVIKETLRLYPLAATNRRGLPDFFISSPRLPVKIPTDGWDLWDANLIVQTSLAFWERGDEFLPERWLAAEGDPLYPPKDGWRPFELGPRACIGQELAMTELRLVTVLVAREIDIEEAWDEWDQVM
jgi:cytochrome P450